MFNKVLLTFLVIFNVLNQLVSFKYTIVLHDEDVFVPCNRPDVYFIDRYINKSKLKFEFLANYSVYVHGEAIWLKDLGTDQNALSVEIFKKDRDKWSPTIYNIKRQDYCTSLFNPDDIFYQYFRNVPKEYQKCPFFVGQTFVFNLTAAWDLILPDPRFAGEYKINLMVYFKAVNEYLCANIFCEFYRS